MVTTAALPLTVALLLTMAVTTTMAMTVLVQHRTHTVSKGKGGVEKREVGKSKRGSGKGGGKKGDGVEHIKYSMLSCCSLMILPRP